MTVLIDDCVDVFVMTVFFVCLLSGGLFSITQQNFVNMSRASAQSQHVSAGPSN
jgi:hypothetical protein